MSTATNPEANETAVERAKPPFLRRVKIRGYKSIAFCDVTLEPLTIFVGRNASGKSNFLDALGFLKDMFSLNLPEAVRRHGGAKAIASKNAERRNEIDISLDLDIASLVKGNAQGYVTYRVTLAIHDSEEPSITDEEIFAVDPSGAKGLVLSRAEYQRIVTAAMPSERAQAFLDRLYPSNKPLAGLKRAGWDQIGLGQSLQNIGIYNFAPDELRNLQRSTPGGLLERSGRNLADVARRLRSHDPQLADRVVTYLAVITDQVEGVDAVHYGEFETLRFRMRTANRQPLMEFDAASMSDGTLRAFAALVAAFQVVGADSSPNLVGIEEPETSLHPAAMRALVDALDEATLRTQILLTTHSADMLDNPTIQPENVRVVEMVDGQTVIAPVDEASVEIVRRKLDTLGGLERQNQLQPNLDDLDRQKLLSQNG
ncbi:MAG: AAA family ATPase, partial [Planctomycetia bacterium]|nr:AAA family ATPase [Planctomycetia bacterium]